MNPAEKSTDQIRDLLLQHVGEQHCISTGDLVEYLTPLLNRKDLRPGDIAPILHDLIYKYRIPLAITPNGYYIIATERELHEYMKYVRGQINQMMDIYFNLPMFYHNPSP